MTDFTPAERSRIRRLALSYDKGRWGLIDMVYKKLVKNDWGDRMQIYRDASDATRHDKDSQPLVSDRTIRDWIRLVRGIDPDVLLLVKQNVLLFEHLETDYALARDGFCERGEAIQWALDQPTGIAKPAAMDKKFRYDIEETEEEVTLRKRKAAIGTFRQLWPDPPQPVAEALDVLERYVG